MQRSVDRAVEDVETTQLAHPARTLTRMNRRWQQFSPWKKKAVRKTVTTLKLQTLMISSIQGEISKNSFIPKLLH